MFALRDGEMEGTAPGGIPDIQIDLVVVNEKQEGQEALIELGGAVDQPIAVL